MSNLSNEELSKQRMRNRSILVLAIVVVSVISVFLWNRIEAKSTADDAPVPGSASGSAAAASSAPAGAGSASAGDTLKKIDGERRKQVLERIKTARQTRATGGASTSAPARPSLPDLPGTLSKDDIRKGVRAVIPLLAECYTNALERLHNAAGRIEVKMHLTGEPEVGTLIDSAEIGGDKVLTGDAELVECFQQTMLSVELPPMAEGGTVDVTYPLEFAP